MALAYFKLKDKKVENSEQKLDKAKFNVIKLNHRVRPKNKNRIIIISCFSEFGCETIGCLYCIPMLVRKFPGRYIIVMGWHGRDYLYRHLIDEFWEIKEEFMWLREHCRAFHHVSKNLKMIEKSAAQHGSVVIPSSMLGKYAVCNFCETCGNFWHWWQSSVDQCPHCKSTVIHRSLFTDIGKNKKQARRLPKPSQKMMDWANEFLAPNTVGVFARGRKTYGRNLQPEFYVKLISLLESKGYNIIWLGEKVTTQPCPVDHVLDFSRMSESKVLEKTLAIVCHCDFTIQFWTASSRLSGMMGTPFILFESPEQLYCSGLSPAQEGKRLELSTFGPKKVVVAHFNRVYEDHDTALGLVDESINEMIEGNYEDLIGMIENEKGTELLQANHYDMLR